MYKTIIIGSGISGIYIGLQLLKYKNDTNFIILEAQPKGHNHGRLISYKFTDKTTIELGASIFHTNQKKINDCISLCNLTNDIIQYTPNKMYMILPDKTSEECNIYFKTLEEKCKSYCLQSKNVEITLDECAKQALNKKEYNDYKLLHYEWFEDFDKNATIYFISSEKIGSICGLKNGMQSIITKGCELLDNHILYNSVVTDINYAKNQYEIKCKDKSYKCKTLYVCTNLENKIKYNIVDRNFKKYIDNYIQLVKSKECIRLYVQFNTKLEHFPNYIVGNQIGKFSIYMGNNVWLIAYTDDTLAIKQNKMNVKELISTWITEMNTIFKTNYNYTNVVKYMKIYWKDAYTTLKKDFYKINSFDKKTKQYYGQYLKEKITQYNKELYLLFVPQNLGEDIAWTEAHLHKI